ncbi:hypothetical protein Aperf_G00000114008 [Anoplocephala perfoliata]
MRWRSLHYSTFYSPRSWYSSKSSSISNSILVAPLTTERSITLPPGLQSCRCDLKFVSRLQIPKVNKKLIVRRAEYSHHLDADHHSLDVRRNRANQQLLYQFALFSCLDLNPDTSPSVLLLDLACGSLLPFGGEAALPKTVFKLGLDQVVSPQSGHDFIRCSLVGSRFPLRDSSIDYLISISFAQWITARDDRRLVNLFGRECLRILSHRHGAGVLQFYPANENDLNMICEALVNAHHTVRGCRLNVRPIENRGVKIFVYFSKN